MSTRLKNTTFNSELDTRIARLEYLISLGLKADNVSTVESKYITYIGDALAKLKLQANSGLNNIDMNMLNSSVNFLSETNIEKKSKQFSVDVIQSPSESSDRETKENVLDAPAGWDGRNSFVYYDLFGVKIDTFGDIRYVKLDIMDLIHSTKDQYINMTKTRRRIVFNSFLRKDNGVSDTYISGGDTAYIFYEKVILKGFVVYWRNR